MPNVIKSIVSKEATRLGYRCLGRSNWQKDLPELAHVIAIQRSRWGGEAYLELGIWLKVFGPDETPKYNECHVRLRLDSDCGLETGDIDDALRDEDLWQMEPDRRGEIIKAALERAETEFFGEMKNLEQVRRFLTDGPPLCLFVNRVVKDYFGIPLE